MNPFQSHLTPHKFMEQTLATIGEKSFSLPEDPETAALTFLQKLTDLGFAEFATIKHFKMVMDSSENSRKGLFRWFCVRF